MEKPKGSILLLVISILLIVGSVISLLFGLLAGATSAILGTAGTLGSEANAALADAGVTTEAVAAVAKGAGILTALIIASSVVDFVSGVVGIVYRNKKEKATLVLIFGIIMILVGVAGTIVPIVVFKSSFNVISFIISLILPILYIVGAVLNKKS